MQHTTPHTTSVEMPDGTLVEITLDLTFTYELNPCDKPPPYSGEDDGWVLQEVSIPD